MPRLMYAKLVAAEYSSHVAKQLKGLLYRAIKKLLRIKSLVGQDKLFEVTLGYNYQDFFQDCKQSVF